MGLFDFSFRFDFWFDGLPASPRDDGSVRACVLRTGRGERALVQSITVSPTSGVHGDSWINHPHSAPGNQVALINWHVIQSLAKGDAQRAAMSGDNLQVDLDLSEDNLPVGTRLFVGTAILRVSELDHRPCLAFFQRFGAAGAKKVARANRRGLRGRGLLCSVEKAGEIRVGDSLRAERPVVPMLARAAASPGH